MKKFIALAFVALCAAVMAPQASARYDKLNYARSAIEKAYVEEVNVDTLETEAIIAMLKTLDPHSSYSNAEETKELTQPLDGKFSGIGVQFSIVKDTVYVVQTTVGGPSERAGLRPGDRIIYVNDSLFTHPKMVNSEVLKKLRGPKGTRVKLKIKRGDNLIDFNLVRDDIPIYSVDATYMVDAATGYIRVSRFAESTPEEVHKAIVKLKKRGMKNLIIDLTDNGGGYLGAAYGMASQFLKTGDIVVSTRGRAMPERIFRVEEHINNDDIENLVVMVNQYSASASEIFAGAIQDYDRGVIVGRRTFGKGLVQTPIPFPDGSMMRLTTARYYVPSGRLIQKEYQKGHSEEYEMDLLTRYKSGELFSADSIRLDKSKEYRTLRNGRPVYGGGGIMPDIFVPVDTTMYSDYYRDLLAKGTINTYAVKYVEKHRKELLKNYRDEDSYYTHFNIDQDIIDGLTDMAREEGIKDNPEQLERSLPIIKGVLKGLIARDTYEDGNYMRAVNHLDPIFVEAMRIINDKKQYDKLLGN